MIILRQHEFSRYKDPMSKKQVNDVAEILKDMGVKGKTLNQLTKNVVKNNVMSLQSDGMNKGEIRQLLQKASRNNAKASNLSGINGASRARRLNAGELYGLKKKVL